MKIIYLLVKTVGSIIRLSCLPNPFIGIMFYGSDIGLTVNLLVEPVVHSFTFFVVGLFYSRGTNWAKGSFLYTLFYSLNVFALYQWSRYDWSIISAIIIINIYGMIIYLSSKLKNKIHDLVYIN